ncbi:MAG: flagellar biosynthetic protein FliO [Acetivibrionales bacterium]|nr:flagellar biosynthetic protein FliO [Clostridiaceae bacterium]
MREVFEILGLILAFGLILLLCYYTTRFVGRKFTGQTNARTKNKRMRVIETLPLGLDKCLYLILIGKQYFLFMSGKKGFELVSEIELDEQTELSEGENAERGIFDFKRIFDTYSGLGNRTDKTKISKQDDEAQDVHEKGILGSIKKLKKINSNNR